MSAQLWKNNYLELSSVSFFDRKKKLPSISIHSSDDENVIIKCLKHFWVGLGISNPLTQLKTSTAAVDPQHLKVEVAD